MLLSKTKELNQISFLDLPPPLPDILPEIPPPDIPPPPLDELPPPPFPSCKSTQTNAMNIKLIILVEKH